MAANYRYQQEPTSGLLAKFFEACENPKPPTESLKEIVRAYGKYAAKDWPRPLAQAAQRQP